MLGSLIQVLQVDYRDIISGRDRKCLEEWVGNLPIGLSAEHGAFLRPNHISILIVPFTC